MTWDRWELGQNHIFYDETIGPHPDQPFPPHAETLRRSMLDFSCAILDAHIGPDGLQQRTRLFQGADPALTSARKAVDMAKRLQNGGHTEKTWEDFFQAQFFKPLHDSVSVSESDSRRVSRCNYYYDGFRLESNENWDVFSTRNSDLPTDCGFTNVKYPRPDRAFYLQMYHLNTESRIPEVHDPDSRQWNLAPECSLAEPFAWSGLKELFHAGLLSTPFRVFDKEPLEAGLKCYPWLLVEHKKMRSLQAEETVCCQAANGGACAVALNQSSATYANKLPFDAHIPPIPTITTMASRVKVWITYYATNFDAPCKRKYVDEIVRKTREKGCVMRLIWEGDMINIEDAIKLRAILENTHTWAMRVFKPLMASYIGQWKHTHDNAGTKTPAEVRREQILRRNKEIRPMIQDVLEDHSTMELDNIQPKMTPMLLGLLVHQVFSAERQLFTGEVERLITEGLTRAQTRNSEQIRPQPANQEWQETPRETRESRQSSFSCQEEIIAAQSDDPNDLEYEPTTADSQDSRSLADGRDDEAQENRQREHFVPENPVPTETHTASPGTTSPTEAASELADTGRNDSAPRSTSVPLSSAEGATPSRPILCSFSSGNTIRTPKTPKTPQTAIRVPGSFFQTPSAATEAATATDSSTSHADTSSPITRGDNWPRTLTESEVASIISSLQATALGDSRGTESHSHPGSARRRHIVDTYGSRKRPLN